MMNRKALVIVICLVVVIVAAVVLMKKPTDKQAAEPESYKIGAVFSVTGRASFLGDPEKKTAEMVTEQINAAGGINGKKIDLIVYDDEGDATKCNLNVKKLINQDKVLAVIGPSISGLSMAVVPVFPVPKINIFI